MAPTQMTAEDHDQSMLDIIAIGSDGFTVGRNNDPTTYTTIPWDAAGPSIDGAIIIELGI